MTRVRFVDLEVPLRFLRTAFEPDDWVAVLLKSYETTRTVQRVGPLSLVTDSRFQAWLRAENASHSNVYISVNAIAPGKRRRTRDDVAVVRHVFVEADQDAPGVLTAIGARRDLPPPSYVVHSSPNRAHVFWRASGFACERVEALQKQLARELHADRAATPCSQTTRLPGFFNHKYRPAPLVTVEYRDTSRRYTPAEFPTPAVPVKSVHSVPLRQFQFATSAALRVCRYLEAVPPAVAGQHGDLHTFRVCCRLVRGFALTDGEALRLLREWNARCQPPWSERDLLEKLRRARRYGREPMAGLLEAGL